MIDANGSGKLTIERSNFPGFTDTFTATSIFQPNGSWFTNTSTVPPGLNLGGTATWVIATKSGLLPGGPPSDPPGDPPTVPEPASVVMLVVGMMGVAGAVWRKGRKSPSVA